MLVTYSGLSFELENIKKFECEAIYSEDGVDFLYNRIRLGMVMVWNPAATTAAAAGPGGLLGPVSVRRLEQMMLTPRRNLTMTLGNITFLESPIQSISSPGVNMRMDCRNGPTPKVFRVIRFDGVKTIVAYWEVEVFANDSLPRNGKPPYLLSHRWKETHQLDELFYQTRVIRGRAVFRNDILDDKFRNNPFGVKEVVLERLYADDFRARLLQDPPQDFVLVSQNVDQSSDGSTLDYTVVQKQQPINLVPHTGVVKWSGQWVRGSNVTGPFDFAQYYVSLVVRAWANRQGSRASLLAAIKRVIPVYGFNIDLAASRAYFHSSIRMDLYERFCEVNVGYRVGGLGDRIGLSLVEGDAKTITERITGSFPEADGVVTTTNNMQAAPEISDGTRSAHVRMIPQKPNDGTQLASRSPVATVVRPTDKNGNLITWDMDFLD